MPNDIFRALKYPALSTEFIINAIARIINSKKHWGIKFDK